MQPRVQVMTKIVIYGRDLIVQNNRLIEAVQDLTLSEKRLMLFLSPLVRRETESDPKRIPSRYVLVSLQKNMD